MKKNSLWLILSLIICLTIISNIGVTNVFENNVALLNNYVLQSQKENEEKDNLDNFISDNDYPIDEEFTYIEETIYFVYDENGNVIFERNVIEVGDVIIDKNFNKFEIYEIDNENCTARAKFIEKLPKPTIKEETITKINNSFIEKKIGLYITHNDESYIDGDGYSSIYGPGGIHDIANQLNNCLLQLGIQTYFDETLHIPHDNSAYSRSKTTAKSLLNNNLNAIFDIHRDGASRKTYVKQYNGEDKCMVRIVVGQANPNKDVNLQFATYLMSVAEDVCPWLFLDIYYAKGHYNQNLSSKALLFEMGSHLVEKDLVEKTVPHLAKVINTTLFNTTVNEKEDELVINNSVSTKPNTIDKVLEAKQPNNNGIIFIIISLACVSIIIGFAVTYYRKTTKTLLPNLSKKT